LHPGRTELADGGDEVHKDAQMHIVHFSGGRINPAAAKVGSVNVIYWLALEQAKAGHRVSVVVLPEKRDYKNIENAGFDILEYASPTRAGFVIDKQLMRDIDSGALKIDIAHLHGVWIPTVAVLAAALRKRRIPYVVASHGAFSPGIMQKQRLRKWGFKLLAGLPLVNKSLFVHIHTQDEAKDALDFGVKAPLVISEQGFSGDAIPPGLDSDWLQRRYPEFQDSFKLIFLGRLDPWHKGIDHLLEAVALARTKVPNVVLFLVGPDKRRYKAEIPKLIEKFNLKEQTILVGPLYDPHEKYSALISADLFVLTSRFEGFPLTVLEALACGVPVLVTRGTRAGEMLNSNEAGIVCASDPKEIAAAIVKAASAREELKSMAARGVELIKSQTWEKAAAILLNEYSRRLKGDAR
jgi:glycosyltransferase involved in cell wall biosynthesis